MCWLLHTLECMLRINVFHHLTHGKCDNILHMMCFTFLHAYTYNNQIINFSDDILVIQRRALAELEVKNHFNESMLQSA